MSLASLGELVHSVRKAQLGDMIPMEWTTEIGNALSPTDAEYIPRDPTKLRPYGLVCENKKGVVKAFVALRHMPDKKETEIGNWKKITFDCWANPSVVLQFPDQPEASDDHDLQFSYLTNYNAMCNRFTKTRYALTF